MITASTVLEAIKSRTSRCERLDHILIGSIQIPLLITGFENSKQWTCCLVKRADRAAKAAASYFVTIFAAIN